MMPRAQEPNALSAGPGGGTTLRFAWRFCLLVLCGVVVYLWLSPPHRVQAVNKPVARSFPARGTIERIDPDTKQVVIAHEAIPSYMGAMTMPFNIRHPEDARGLQVGDVVSFRLSVTETESWIDQIVKLAHTASAPTIPARPADAPALPQPRHPLLAFAFTNELGRPVTLSSFEGQALAITFFFTRCPVPDFCPRLSRNFAEASRELSQLDHGPTNWHFLSVSFDPDFDTPAALKAYAQRYQYDPAHWSFLTGPKDKIAELARLSNVQFESEGGLFNHNFRTMIIDATGRLQMVFPIGGDLSKDIVSEMRKAATAGPAKPS